MFSTSLILIVFVTIGGDCPPRANRCAVEIEITNEAMDERSPLAVVLISHAVNLSAIDKPSHVRSGLATTGIAVGAALAGLRGFECINREKPYPLTGELQRVPSGDPG